jgi:hypothetical protein
MRFLASAILCTVLPALAFAAPTGVTVSRVNTQTVGARQISSSTSLAVRWSATPADNAHHFEIAATEGVQGTSVVVTAAAAVTSINITGLKSNTEYAVVVKACANEACTASNAAAAVIGSTDAEYWQLRGTGNRVDTLTKIVADGNARLSATRFGPDAGAMANHIQLYYGPMGTGRTQNLAVATNTDAADAARPDTILSFTSRTGVSGLASPSSTAPLVGTVATGQGVPLARSFGGGKVRLFFEATGSDNKSRVMWLDSQDGYFGLDFNAGSASTCSTTADYSTGGGCVPTVAIPVEGDANGNAKITNSRQFKLAWPTLDSPHWDGAAGTFMVFTSDRVQGCSNVQQNHGYAVWDGNSTWKVQYAAGGCPKLFTSAQAAFPMHLGGVRYKMYYGDPSITTGKVSASSLPFLGPKKLIYADGRVNGTPELVDFEDWEAQTSAREVVFLWPNGDVMDASAEGYIDDYHFLAPTGTLDLQVMYLTITDGAIVPIAAAAILLNP